MSLGAQHKDLEKVLHGDKHHMLLNEDPLVRQQSKVWLLLVFHSFPLPYLRVAATAYWETTLFGGRIFFFLTFCSYNTVFKFLSLPGSSLGPLLAAVVKSAWTFIDRNSCKWSPGFVTTRQPQPPKTQDLQAFACPSADSLAALRVHAALTFAGLPRSLVQCWTRRSRWR